MATHASNEFEKELRSMAVIYAERTSSALRIETELAAYNEDARKRINGWVTDRLKAEKDQPANSSSKGAAA